MGQPANSLMPHAGRHSPVRVTTRCAPTTSANPRQGDFPSPHPITRGTAAAIDAILLTEMGGELFPVISAMLAWGDKWLDGGGGAPVQLYHETCGHDAEPQVVCSNCGKPIVAAEVQLCVGPGFPETVDCGTDFRHRLAAFPGGEGGRPHAHRTAS
jgi:hypothetical protein